MADTIIKVCFDRFWWCFASNRHALHHAYTTWRVIAVDACRELVPKKLSKAGESESHFVIVMARRGYFS